MHEAPGAKCMRGSIALQASLGRRMASGFPFLTLWGRQGLGQRCPALPASLKLQQTLTSAARLAPPPPPRCRYQFADGRKFIVDQGKRVKATIS